MHSFDQTLHPFCLNQLWKWKNNTQMLSVSRKLLLSVCIPYFGMGFKVNIFLMCRLTFWKISIRKCFRIHPSTKLADKHKCLVLHWSRRQKSWFSYFVYSFQNKQQQFSVVYEFQIFKFKSSTQIIIILIAWNQLF